MASATMAKSTRTASDHPLMNGLGTPRPVISSRGYLGPSGRHRTWSLIPGAAVLLLVTVLPLVRVTLLRTLQYSLPCP